MMGRGLYLQRRIDARYRQRGSQIVLRRVNLLPGSNAQVNPPALKSLTVAVAGNPGNTTIALSAVMARGRFVAGDQLLIGAVVATVAADAIAAGNAFAAVPLRAGLSAAVAAGAAVNTVFAADETVYAYITNFSNTVIDGERIQVNDLNVGISAYNAGAPPTTQDRLIILGVEKAILSVQSKINDNQQLTWQCHVR